MFAKAEQYGSFKNAPQNFQNEFKDSYQKRLTEYNKAKSKLDAERDAKMDKVLSLGNKEMYNAAMSEFLAKEKRLNDFMEKLRTIENKFNS